MRKKIIVCVSVAVVCFIAGFACYFGFSSFTRQPQQDVAAQEKEVVTDKSAEDEAAAVDAAAEKAAAEAAAAEAAAAETAAAEKAAADAAAKPSADELRAALNITERYYDDLNHGVKTSEYQKYIVLHDTEGDSSPANTIDWWESNGSYVAAHFVVGRDGSIYQCVPLDGIAHHAGYGETGNNEAYGVTDQSRDDMRGTTSIGSAYADYGMNSHSVGIEMVHVGGSGDYPEAQLEALDGLIAYIDAYYGFESTIIDHKMWRSTNSDTSAEFAEYLANYQATRTHDGSARD